MASAYLKRCIMTKGYDFIMVRLDVDFHRRSLGVLVNIWNKNKNGFEEMDALFDTGAHTCAIDIETFHRLGYDLETAVNAFVSTASSSREAVSRVRIEKMMLGDALLEKVMFNAFDFPLISRPVIIGMNLIRQFEVSMNFKSKLITMKENYLCEGDDYYDADTFGDWRIDNI